MARLNTRPSNVPSSRFSSETPRATPQRDSPGQENRDPNASTRDKGKARAMGPPLARSSLPTPTSDGSDASRGQKRKRAEVRFEATQGTQTELDEDEQRFTRHFDPNQDPEERRQTKRASRALEREYQENRDELLRGNGEGLSEIVNKANGIYKGVKQTNDATLDSRLLVNVSDLASKKTAQLVLGDTSTGVDVDEFLSKCITFMRNGGPANSQDDQAPSTSRRRRTRDRDDDEVDEDEFAGEALDWELLGRHACFPHNSRPPVPNFLLGPLSVEKKQRTQTQRRARQTKDTTGREARPEALTKEDMQQSDENGLTAICIRIRSHLAKHIQKAGELIDRAGFTEDDVGSERYKSVLKKCRMASNGGVSLFEYVVNPRSFGQTVENMFYISFLIKEGVVGVSHDEDGLPTLDIAQAHTLEEQRKEKISKHQAVFAIDYSTWQQLIEAFDISEPMIPHREDEQPAQVGERGWYT